MDEQEANILEEMDGGGWRYSPTKSSAETSYEIAAKQTEKLATSLGVDVADIQTAWAARFGTSDRQVALTWLRNNGIPTKTRFAWVNRDWNK